MTDVQKVMKSEHFIGKYRRDKAYVVVLSGDPVWPNLFRREVHLTGHSWAEVFRKAVVYLVTQRVKR